MLTIQHSVYPPKSISTDDKEGLVVGLTDEGNVLVGSFVQDEAGFPLLAFTMTKSEAIKFADDLMAVACEV